MRVLVVEDSPSLARSLERGLKKIGFAVDVAADGKKGLTYARVEPYDVVVLDIMLPLMSGLEILRHLREEGRDVPVLMLTARDSVADRVKGLEIGADDYLVKPFAFRELVARLTALVRRRSGKPHPIIEVAGLTLDTSSRKAIFDGRVLDLTAREYALLVYLALRKGEIVSRIELEDHLYGEKNFPMSNAVTSAVSALRSKIGEGRGAQIIRTRRGLGYVLGDESS